MVLEKITHIFIYSSIVNGFFLAFILTRSRKWEKRSNKILALLLIILSLSIIHSAVIDVETGFPFRIKEPFIMLLGPFLLFYIRELFYQRKFKLVDVLHFIPFIVLTVIFLLHSRWNVSKEHPIMNYTDAISIWTWGLQVVQYSIYWWIIIRQINRYNSAIQTELSNIEGKTLIWAKNFLHIFGIGFVLITITIPLVIHTNDYYLVDSIICLILAGTIYVLGYEGLIQEEIFSNNVPLPQDEFELITKKGTDSPAKPAEASNESMQILLDYMEENKPYLNEKLTLTHLAAEININRNQLSFLINSITGENFFQFINKYRIEEVKKSLADPDKKNYTILALAYEAGFSSKSSFQSIFKKITGLTPTEYLSQLK